tara:strand:- start:17027 stop:17377 length:351 start_codon:yes stop_codon:yes gene_type:complete
MKQILAIARQLLAEVKDVTQESMDLNPTSFTKRSGFVQTVEWRVNHLLEELKEAINVYNNRWEAIIEDNERWEETLAVTKDSYEEKLSELLTIIEEKNELIDELSEGNNGISIFEE